MLFQAALNLGYGDEYHGSRWQMHPITRKCGRKLVEF